jgi:glucose/arabinose dehydrogenase
MKSLFKTAYSYIAVAIAFAFSVACNSSATNTVPVAEDTASIENPIPDSIRNSGIVAGLKLFTQMPATGDEHPLTRIIKFDHQPGTKDIFIQDLRGKLYRIKNGKAQVYMDIKHERPKFILQPGLATGFGSFTFHPDFQKNGLLYTTHAEPAKTATADFSYNDTIPVALQWVVTEWKTDPQKFPFSGEGRELLRLNVPTGIHGMQEIAFNDKASPGDEDYGLLYIGIGDGGSVETHHPLVNGTPTVVWGSILRIDPAGKNSRNGKYGIPASNPFANKPDYAPEIYAYGFRNPHKFNWSHDKRLFAVNIGQHQIEAVDIILPGHFYGWPLREGSFLLHNNEIEKVYKLPGDDSAAHVTYPVAAFDHDEGTAICGGYDYEGKLVPQLKGKYVFGDIASGKLFYAEMKDLKIGQQATVKEWNIAVDGKQTSLEKLCGHDRVEMRYGMDADGELYVFTKWDGKVYKVIDK